MGHLIGEHVNDYQAFSYDLSAFVIPGKRIYYGSGEHHVLARVVSGSGLYREAFLTVLPKVHLDKDRLRLSLSQAAEKSLGLSQQVSLGTINLALVYLSSWQIPSKGRQYMRVNGSLGLWRSQ
ncbi:hypothetical protein KP784_09055 [Streptococcus equi subsp. zooepidemicus]|nr:hypothetical protein [Streptococcus equi subsp. zooepidemicus]